MTSGAGHAASSLVGSTTLADELIHLTTVLATERNLERGLGAIIAAACRLMSAGGGRIFALDRSQRTMQCVAGEWNGAAENVAGVAPIGVYAGETRYNMGDASVFASVTGRVVAVPDVYRYSGFDFSATATEDRRSGVRTRGFLVVPLWGIDGTTLGVLQLRNLAGMRDEKYTEEGGREKLIRTFASFAAVAIAIGRLFDDNRQLVRQLDRKATELERENSQLKKSFAAAGNPPSGMVVGGPAMQKAIDLARRAACGRVTVLLLGETGVGKDVMAKFIHRASDRAKGPLVVQNCAALPEHLLESELFGFKRGAFSGAVADKRGLVHEAEGGTLFLDEIGDMPIGLQAKILRMLEDGVVRRLGDTVGRAVDVRIVAATNVDLTQKISQGLFREDLYYRLGMFPIHIPPLRERTADIPRLIEVFLKEACDPERKPPPTLTSHALDALLAWQFPGNIRELRNIISRAALLVDAGERIDLRHLPAEIATAQRAAAPLPVANTDGSLRAMVRQFEARMIESKLRELGWNQSRAATELKISRRGLIDKLDRYSIRPPETV